MTRYGRLLSMACALVLLAAAAAWPHAPHTYPPGLFAELDTNKGLIVLQLEFEKTPMTVANFVGLAEGTIENKALPPGTPFFDGTVWHRVVPGHVIQAGQPKGGVTSGPGYSFPNEIVSDLNHGRAGMVGMANSGPHTNSSQFYITLGDRSYLDGNYTVFGHVIEGMDVVNSIVQGDFIKSVKIVRSGRAAQAFKADTSTFQAMADAARAKVKEADEKKASDEAATIAKNWPGAKTSAKGARYIVRKEGDGSAAQAGQTVTARYTGKTFDGRPIASSGEEGKPVPGDAAQPFDFVVGKTRITPALEEALGEMRVGEKRTVIAQGRQAYGTGGFYAKDKPGEKRFVIAPNTTLVYEVEMIAIK